jgi:hypothetical protein
MHLHDLIDIFLRVSTRIYQNFTVLGELVNHFFRKDVPALSYAIVSFEEQMVKVLNGD